MVALVSLTSRPAASWMLLTYVAFTAFLMWPIRIALLSQMVYPQEMIFTFKDWGHDVYPLLWM